jgi:hypothetical protein
MRLRKRKNPAAPEVQRHIDAIDSAAIREGRAIVLAPRTKTARITSSIAWVPSKPSGDKGWLRLSESRKMRGQFVRGKSNRTPKLHASYVRAFDVPDTAVA